MKGFNIVPKQRQVATIALLLSTLSDREREVLNKVCLGYDAAAIADKQHVSTTTIQAHRARLLRKMGARNSVQLTYLIKSAETHHLKRHIEKLLADKNNPQTQFGVLNIVPSSGGIYPSAAPVTVQVAAEQRAALRPKTQREESI